MGYKQFLFTILMLSAMMTVGCAKDMTQQDYQAHLLANDLARYRAKDGTYRGMAISKQNGKYIGAISVSLTARPIDSSSANQSGMPVVVYKAQVTIAGPVTAAINGVGQLDQDNVLTVNFPIAGSSPGNSANVSSSSGNSQAGNSQGSNSGFTNEGISLSATISGNELTGDIEADVPSFGARIRLIKNGPSLTKLLKTHTIDKNLLFVDRMYTGETTFLSQHETQRRVNLSVLRLAGSASQEFYNLLSSEKPVILTLDYGDGAVFSSKDATFDLMTGNIAWNTIIGSDQMRNTCQTDPSNSNLLSCDHRISDIGLVGVTQVQRVPRLLPIVNHDTANRATTQHIYHGMGKFSAHDSFESVNLIVTYQERDELTEISYLFDPPSALTFDVSMEFVADDTPFPALGSASWDINANELNASNNLTVLPFHTQLSCQNFKFFESRYDFTCTYLNSANPYSSNVRFNGRLN